MYAHRPARLPSPSEQETQLGQVDGTAVAAEPGMPFGDCPASTAAGLGAGHPDLRVDDDAVTEPLAGDGDEANLVAGHQAASPSRC